MAENKQPAVITPLVNAARTGIAGQASRFMMGDYKINNAIYPIDLFNPNNNQYGDNYVIFYINVPESSKLISEGRVQVTGRDTTEIGSAFGALIEQFKSNIDSDSSDKSEEYMGLGLRQNKRITDTITLYTPNNLTTRYSVSWDAEDMVLATAGADVVNAVTSKSSSQSAGIDKFKSAVKGGSALGANIAMSKLPGGAAMSAASGLAANPKKEQLFKNVDFRTFNFEYQFAPKNKQESDQVKKIIDLFKLHMHPEYKDTAGFLFLYPSEFEIVYYQGDSENMNLPRHTSSVLIDMSINYTPQGMYNTFEDGASTLITVNLTFKELAILTKAEILDGF